MIRQISCGDYHAAFITEPGQLFSIGRNHSGQLGIGDQSLKFSTCPLLVEGIKGSPIDVKCGGLHTACLTKAGHVFTWGKGAIA